MNAEMTESVKQTQIEQDFQTQQGTNAIQETKKEFFADKDAIISSTFNAIKEPDKKVAPMFFLEDNAKVKIDVSLLNDPITGKILAVYPKGAVSDSKIEKHLVKTDQWFEFTVPTYEDVSLYRQKSSKYQEKETVVDSNMFRNFLLAMHLKAWSLTDKEGNPVPLETDLNDILSNESIKFVNKVPTVVWDIVLTAFERETLIM